MNKALKNRIINGIELLPFGHDIYLHLVRKRLGITYRGVFESYHQAQANTLAQLTSQYDIINKNKSEHLESELPIIDKRVLDIDYPLLFWISQVLSPSNRVLDLGGSLGQSFYSFEHYFPYPDGIEWIIAELPEAVNAGAKIAEQRNEERLSFIESDKLNLAEDIDIFITAGTLQYMDASFTGILNQLRNPPEHILIHNLPAHRDNTFWTLQYLEVCEVPYHITSINELINDMKVSGYQLVDNWKNGRQVNIPFHLDKKVDGYFGFYFKKKPTHGSPNR